MSEVAIAGWDVGGAHLKAAFLGGDGRLVSVMQLPCPLWKGVDRLEAALSEALCRAGAATRNAVTMTGELADCFESRAEGVRKILAAIEQTANGRHTRVYLTNGVLVTTSN